MSNQQKKVKWEDLTEEEQQKWNNQADKANKLGLGLFAKTVGGLLEDGTLLIKDDKLMISGPFAFKMLSEKGISKEMLSRTMNEILHRLIPQKNAQYSNTSEVSDQPDKERTDSPA